MKLFLIALWAYLQVLIALWAYLQAHPDASFEEFQLAADRAARLARWPS